MRRDRFPGVTLRFTPGYGDERPLAKRMLSNLAKTVLFCSVCNSMQPRERQIREAASPTACGNPWDAKHPKGRRHGELRIPCSASFINPQAEKPKAHPEKYQGRHRNKKASSARFTINPVAEPYGYLARDECD